ncbi:MAG: SAM-dependent chlorinase/fluorinase [Bacteroidota bacterium]
MNIVTLTTDLGLKDYYVAVLKGELMKAVPGATIVDITHDIEPFSYSQAAFVLLNSYHHFPKGTIHLIGVDTNSFKGMKHLIAEHNDAVFIGPDNGIFALLFEDKMPEKIYALNEKGKHTLPISDLYVKAAKHIVDGNAMEEIGQTVTAITRAASFRPIISGNYIKGTVVHVDRFDNVMLNIRREEFENTRQGRKFVVTFKRNDDIDRLEENYSSINDGNISCVVNSGGYIELFMKHGNMAGLLGLKVSDSVHIEFK